LDEVVVVLLSLVWLPLSPNCRSTSV